MPAITAIITKLGIVGKRTLDAQVANAKKALASAKEKRDKKAKSV